MIRSARIASAVFGFIAACAVGVPVPAGWAASAGLSAEDQAAVRRIEDYINSITTLQARFIQLNPNGRFVEGSLYISRPGRLRFEYDPPIPYRLIVDGGRVIFYDAELDAPAYLSVDDTPLDILLADKVSLSNGVEVTKVERGPGSLRVTLIWSERRDQGTVQITFSERPLELKKWSLISPKGVAIHIAILNARFGVALDPKLFEFKDPTFYKSDRFAR